MRNSWIAGAFLISSIGFGFPVYAQVGLNVDVETRVREYFATAPVMVEIARCESKFRHYTDSGNALHGGAGAAMIGVFQIFSDVHAEYAQSIGMDIYTLEGNLAYAKKLYDEEGTRPWNSSRPCWGDTVTTVVPSGQSGAELTINLSSGIVHPQVLLLQRKLNAGGYSVAAEGPGAPGQETEKFGALTRAAVQKFQCSEMQICDGDEQTTGYGFVGPRTRVALAVIGGAPSLPSPSATPSSSGAVLYQDVEIERLQSQIAELTKTLAELLAARSL